MRKEVGCFHFPIIPQLKNIQQFPFFLPKYLTTKLKTRESPKNYYVHYNNLLSTLYAEHFTI